MEPRYPALTDPLFWSYPVPAWIFDVQTFRFLAVNDAAIQTYGYTRDEFAAMTTLDLRDANEQKRHIDFVNRPRAASEGSEQSAGWKHILRDGRVITVDSVTSVEFQCEGRRARATVITDVSERTMLLESARAMLSGAERIAALGSWSTDLRTKHVTYSGELQRLFAPQPDDCDYLRVFLERIDGEQPEALATFTDAFATGTPFDLECRLHTSDGLRWYHARGELAHDAAGAAVRLVGTLLDIDERRSTLDRLERIAYIDQATGLPNRAALRRELANVSLASGAALVVVKLDPMQMASEGVSDVPEDVCSAAFRRIAPSVVAGCYVARLSEQKFVFLFSGEDGARSARVWGRQVIRIFDDPLDVGNVRVAVKPMVSLAVNPPQGGEAKALFANAQTAVDAAALRGADFVESSVPMLVTMQRRAKIDRYLRDAIAQRQLELHYQPVVATADSSVVAIEALMRWKCDALGRVAPDEFIAVAEESGYIERLGDWAFDRAFADFSTLVFEGADRPRIMINVSPRQLRQRDFYGMVMSAASRYGIRPDEFGIELTENAMMHDLRGTGNKILRGLREEGVRIALDDFGTGYSSLKYLASLPLDQIKIDRSFVSAMTHDPYKRAVIRTVIELAQELGLSVVGEGIELPEEAAALTRMGCNALQGYLIGVPMCFSDLQRFITAPQHFYASHQSSSSA
ncbi:MAG: hypothetical protein NVSMB64_02260 [Candidatus Velthaea sp.]